MKREEWEAVFGVLPPNLTLQKVAQLIDQPYRLTATWARRLNYRWASGHKLLWTLQRRRMFQRAPWHRINWSLSNADIARKYGVSREIVRRRRQQQPKQKT